MALTLEGYCGRPLTENADIDDVSQEYWTFYKSVVFVLTVVSTVGTCAPFYYFSTALNSVIIIIIIICFLIIIIIIISIILINA